MIRPTRSHHVHGVFPFSTLWVFRLSLAAFAVFAAKAQAQTVVDPALEVILQVSSLAEPTSMALLPGLAAQPLEFLVCEKATGRVMHVRGSMIVGTALDLAVNSRSERGLLGIALHPAFASNHSVYVYYSASSTAIDNADQNSVAAHRVERYVWDGGGLSAPTLILALPATPGPNHDGGVILFGPDGMLYGAVGDLNRNGQLENYPTGPAPDDSGILFRVNDDGSPPTDNPFFGLGGNMAKVYAYGVRNSFGLDFDPATAVLWDTENGPTVFDEINRVLPGFNSGWEQIMGPDAEDPQGLGDLWVATGSRYEDPQFSWRAPVGVAAMHFVRGGVLGPEYAQDLLVGDNNTGTLYRFELSADRASLIMPTPETSDRIADSVAERNAFRIGSGFGTITDMETGPDGVYVCSYGGSIYRIRRNPTAVRDTGWGDLKELYRAR